MNGASVVAPRQPEEIVEPPTEILRSRARPLIA